MLNIPFSLTNNYVHVCVVFTQLMLFFPFSYICFKNKLNIPIFVTGILAGLVSITGKLTGLMKNIVALTSTFSLREEGRELLVAKLTRKLGAFRK